MAKNLFEVMQNLFMLAALLSVVISCITGFKDVKIKKWFVRGMLCIAVLTVTMAILRDKRIIKYNQIHNIRLLMCSVVLGLAFAVLSCIDAAKKKKLFAVQLAAAATGALYTGVLMLYRLPTILSLPFHFVGRDESAFSTDFLLRMTGYLLAFIVLCLLVLALYKILSRSPKVTGAVTFCALYAVNTFISFVGILGIINSYYRRKFKIPTALRTKLPALIKAEFAVLFVAVAVLFVVTVIFIIYNVKIHGEYTNPAEHRRLRANARNNRRWGTFALLLLAFTVADFTAIKKLANRIVELSPSEEYELNGNEIHIPLTQVSDGHLHRFTWDNGNGKSVRFIIVQKKGTNFGIGFDACEICGNVGYYERKNEIVCNRCDVVMNKSTIGLKGGCNPIPLASKIENGGIIIYTEDLNKEAKRF